jgi:hypothetical protein
MASKKQKLENLPIHLRGLSNNRWGGHKSNKMRGFRGSTYGAANRGKYIPLTPKLMAEYENKYPVNQR